MAGIKQRGPKSENYKRTVIRDGVEVEIKPPKINKGEINLAFILS